MGMVGPEVGEADLVVGLVAFRGEGQAEAGAVQLVHDLPIRGAGRPSAGLLSPQLAQGLAQQHITPPKVPRVPSRSKQMGMADP